LNFWVSAFADLMNIGSCNYNIFLLTHFHVSVPHSYFGFGPEEMVYSYMEIGEYCSARIVDSATEEVNEQMGHQRLQEPRDFGCPWG
jgi:hypothetical protein